MQYKEFTEARNIVLKLKISDTRTWKKLCKKNKIPNGIPKHPEVTYANHGWTGYGDWLGTKRTKPSSHFRSYVEAKIYVNSLDLQNFKQWREYCKSGKKPNDIPSSPERTYKNQGWTWWGDWIGNTKMKQKSFSHLPFSEAKDYVRALKIKNLQQWYEYCASNKLPLYIPTNPNKKYKDKGWCGYKDWLGSVQSKQKIPTTMWYD